MYLSSNKFKQHREMILLAIILVGAFALRMFFLSEPFERDEGWYGTIAQEILHGGIPYRDAIDQKPPGVFYLYALGMAIFGKTTEAIRVYTAVYASFTLLTVYWLAKKIAGVSAGLWAGAVCAIFSSAPLLQASSSNSEVFLVLPLMLSACMLVAGKERQSHLLLAASGFFAGVAMLIKTVALPYCLVLAGGALFHAKGRTNLKTAGKNLLIFSLPAVVLALLTMLYFYINGAFAEFIHWNITAPLKYSKGGTGVGGPPLQAVLKNLKYELIFPALLSIPAAALLLLRHKDLPSVLGALLLPASAVAVLMPGMNFPHYFIQLIPFMSVLAGISLAAVFTKRGMLFWCAAPLVLALLIYAVQYEYRFYLKFTPQEVSMAKYGATFVQSERVAQYLKERTNEGDYIFQWGFEPELYFLSGRRTPVPFISSTILANMEDPAAAIRQMIVSLENKRPKYIVVQPEWANWPGYDELTQFVNQYYLYETTVEYALVFRHR